ncbi:MAG TPA: ABC transporter ATP-binding protein, partial [Devosia sp.]|nr:ABC transporter ATP-binding protein [Devosia sp.]
MTKQSTNEGSSSVASETVAGAPSASSSIPDSVSASDVGHWGPRGTAGVSFAAALSFDAVEVQIGARTVLNKLDLALVPGEILCLLGESGSGKSTVLRVAAGIQAISGGEVRVNGTLVSSKKMQVSPDQRGVGLMFQDFALFPHLNLLNNVCFGLNKIPRKEAVKRARAALKRVGLQERENDFPHMLSGGQQQRLALARTFAPRPGILMLDEPFSSLDARLRENVRTQTLAILRETRATTIIVTHDPEEAMVLGDRIALLRDGQVAQIDTVSRIYSNPADLQIARFFSTLTEIDAVVNDGFAQTPLGIIPTPDRADHDKITLAFRPVGALEISSNSQGVPARILTKHEALGFDIFEVQVREI